MRVIIKFTKNTIDVPFNNQSTINSFIHKCLGKDNIYHDTKNDYCVSSLQGGKMLEDKKNLTFENGGYIVITSDNSSFLNDLLGGVMSNQYLNWGMTFEKFDFIKEDFNDGWNHFLTLSPFIIKKYIDRENYKFSTIYDDDFSEIVKKHTINKLSKIYPDIDLKDFDLKIDYNPSHKVKSIMVKNVVNKSNQCQICVFSSSDIAEKLYNIGIGQSTGSGFGTIYKKENHKKYRIG